MSYLQQNWRKGQTRFCLEASTGEEGGVGQGGRNDPSNVCTYEYINKEKIPFHTHEDCCNKNQVLVSMWKNMNSYIL
jgi:hypothetical protein